MSLYIISWDLENHASDEHRHEMESALVELGTAHRLLETTFSLETPESIEVIDSKIFSVSTSNDRYAVALVPYDKIEGSYRFDPMP